MKAACLLNPHTHPIVRELGWHAGDTVVLGESLPQIEHSLPDIDALIISTGLYTEEVRDHLLEHAARLRWLQVMSSGVDKILKIGVPPGVVLTSCSGANAAAVADHALALVLALIRRLPDALEAQRAGRWDAKIGHAAATLDGKRALVIGFGQIGQAISRRLAAFGARVTAVNRGGRTKTTDLAGAEALESVARLPALLPEARIVVLCLPGTDATRGLLGREQIALLPAESFLVNVGRGTTLDEAALTEALANGRLAGAGLDVFETEPLGRNSRLWSLPNVILTPHYAGRGASLGLLRDIVAENIARMRSGRPLVNAYDGAAA